MKRERRKVLVRLLDVVLVLLLLAAAIAVANRVLQMRRHLASAQHALDQLESALAGGEAALVVLLQDPDQVANVQSVITSLDADLTALEELAGPLLPLCPCLGWLPGIGGDVAAAPHLLDMARQTSRAALELADALAPLAERSTQLETGLSNLGPEVVRGLGKARPQIESSQAALVQAAESRAAVDIGRLSAMTRTMVERFDHYQPLMETGLRTLAILPGLLGADGPRDYLLLAQNNQELRATGGFISGVGLIRIEEGGISEMSFRDSYTVDDLTQPHPSPPDALRQHMGAGMLVLRDANWWPDFPSSAQVIADLYRQEQGQDVDGVIAVDLTTLHLLVQALGPIQVPGYDEPVTSGNLQSMIMTYWEAPRLSAPGKEGADWWEHRKDFAADLLSALLTRLMEHATPDDLTALVRAISTAVRERHLLIYVNSFEAQAFLRQMGWDGALRPAAGDYLMIVDSNVGFNKVNPNVEQTVDYQVALDGVGTATVRLSLNYRHRIQHPAPACIHEPRYGDSYADLLERCYWDYLRLYLPEGSELIQIAGADAPAEVYQEAGRTVVATSFLLETGQARQIQITYRPGIPLSTERYTLLIQKQPGTGGIPLRVSITPPEGSQPIAASPEGMVWLGSRAVWQGDLAQDRAIDLSWR